MLCYADDEKIVFCSSFRILEAMGLPNLRLDPHGAGIALAAHAIVGRTLPFEGCWRLGAGEVLSCEEGCLEQRRYWRWAAIGPKEQTEEQALRRATDLLRESVRLRLRSDRDAKLLLSGGLDSRVVAACLLDEGVAVNACTLGPEGTADLAFARLFADAAGLELRERLIARQAFAPTLGPYAAAAFRREGSPSVRVWNGFDGSFQLGHTFHYDPFIPAQREGRVREVTRLFARKKGYGWAGCRRVLREPLASAVESSLPAMLARYFEEEAPPDKGRTIYAYQAEIGNPPLMQTEFADLDLHRVEYLTPLADFVLIEHMMTVDPEICQRHRFYYRMLDYLPPGIRAVPWQSYPTQDPCPVPGPVFAETQWERTPAARGANHRHGMAAIPKIFRGGLPGRIFKRANLITACALHAMRLGNYAYHFDRVLQLQRWLRMTDASAGPRR